MLCVWGIREPLLEHLPVVGRVFDGVGGLLGVLDGVLDALGVHAALGDDVGHHRRGGHHSAGHAGDDIPVQAEDHGQAGDEAGRRRDELTAGELAENVVCVHACAPFNNRNSC